MWIAVVNNIPELVLGGAWTGLIFWAGTSVGRWYERRKSRKARV